MDAVEEKIEELLGATERFIDKDHQKQFNTLILRIRRIWRNKTDDQKLVLGVLVREVLDDMRQDMEELK